jgi:hypothetical protein
VTTFTGFDMFLQISLRSKGATAFRAPVLDGFHMSLSLQNCYITAFQFTWFALLVAAVPPRVLIIPGLPSGCRVGKVSGEALQRFAFPTAGFFLERRNISLMIVHYVFRLRRCLAYKKPPDCRLLCEEKQNRVVSLSIVSFRRYSVGCWRDACLRYTAAPPRAAFRLARSAPLVRSRSCC